MSIDTILAAYFIVALVATTALVTKAPRLSKVAAIVSNFALGISALLPVALVRLGFASDQGNYGIFAVLYFVCFIAGLMMMNWRYEKARR